MLILKFDSPKKISETSCTKSSNKDPKVVIHSYGLYASTNITYFTE